MTATSFQSDFATKRRTPVTPPKPSAEQDVGILIHSLADALEDAIDEITEVNAETKILSLNARIEAARAGIHGAAFGVVAEEMQSLSDRTAEIARTMASATRDKTTQLTELINTSIRGTRLSDLALVNVDLIDRNLYERTCDVRWWATDSSLVNAVEQRDPDSCLHASKRMGVILNAYTVYFDLVLCDRDGRIIANGRPDRFSISGRDQSREAWFGQAVQSRSGDEYGFQYARHCELVDHQPALIYSCSVRRAGDANSEVLGALGVIFNWSGLAAPILDHIPVSEADRPQTNAYIVTREGVVLASNRPQFVGEKLGLANFDQVISRAKGHFLSSVDGKEVCVGHAAAPGFETYSTGWYSVITQPAH